MRNGETVYFRARNAGANLETPTYAAHASYVLRYNYLTIQPASGYLDMLAYGERIHKFWNGVANYDAFNGKISEGDLAYLDGATPTGETTNGENANAVVRSVLLQNRTIYIVFEKIV